MQAESETFLILGITPEGRPFRPSDWAERLCGALASYDNRGRWVYSNYAQPVIYQGKIGVRVEKILQDADPAAYQFIMAFASGNRLKIEPEEEVIHPQESAVVQEIVLPARKLTFAI
ncbi:DUF3579 domain-containing protein [Nitrosomonas oligotropha]|uniref:DUF3579 domain-containing protein n=1 Tax=Nitrosomonas oligotropha TaxID=42354 RepID=UPI00136B1AA3|nr:DUF3579 domain-containing protein [Nitrosomonas oligotropha]MXS84071.1 DUF3579 domain-containing protein [Nitrosomonas oligotropha]